MLMVKVLHEVHAAQYSWHLCANSAQKGGIPSATHLWVSTSMGEWEREPQTAGGCELGKLCLLRVCAGSYSTPWMQRESAGVCHFFKMSPLTTGPFFPPVAALGQESSHGGFSLSSSHWETDSEHAKRSWLLAVSFYSGFEQMWGW